MNSNEAEPTVIAPDGGVQQIPAVVADGGVQQIPAVSPVPAAAAGAAYDALLRAISAEAQHVADKFPGHASKALARLAHAYALVTAGTTVTTNFTPAAGRRMADYEQLAPPNGSPIGDDYIVIDVPKPITHYYPPK